MIRGCSLLTDDALMSVDESRKQAKTLGLAVPSTSISDQSKSWKQPALGRGRKSPFCSDDWKKKLYSPRGTPPYKQKQTLSAKKSAQNPKIPQGSPCSCPTSSDHPLPTDIRLLPFILTWEAITTDVWVQTVICVGYAIEFQMLPLPHIVVAPPSPIRSGNFVEQECHQEASSSSMPLVVLFLLFSDTKMRWGQAPHHGSVGSQLVYLSSQVQDDQSAINSTSVAEGCLAGIHRSPRHLLLCHHSPSVAAVSPFYGGATSLSV